MKVVMLAYHTPKEGDELKPGEAYEGFDDAEAQRQIKIGGARLPRQDEFDAWAKEAEARAAAEAREAEAKAAAEVAAKAAAVGAGRK
jgi:hypothetical protein